MSILQQFKVVVEMPISLSPSVCEESITGLNSILANTMALRDLYKKSHWQVSGPLFYSLHLLFDSHFGVQGDLVDLIAERIMMLGGISIAGAADVVKYMTLPSVPQGREDWKTQINELLNAHDIILNQCRKLADTTMKNGDVGTNDMLLSDVIRPNEKQVWFLKEHLDTGL